MVVALRVSEFDEESRGVPVRWIDGPAPLTNAQLLELKHALDEQGVLLVELAQEVLGLRMRVEAAERTVDEFDVSVLLHEDRLDRVELVLDSEQLGVLGCPAPFLTDVPTLEEYASLHEVGAALSRLYRSVGICEWERAVTVFRVGWELAVPEGERLDLATVWGWLQERSHGGQSQ